VAVISHQQNEIITYAELHSISDNLAAGLLATGVKRGDRVAVMLGNRSEYIHVCVYPDFKSFCKILIQNR
jgi:non-ribosomal peptide synthetase component E (peptide arylation enzyme)